MGQHLKKTSIPLRHRSFFKNSKGSSLTRQRQRSTILHQLIGIVKRHPDGFGFFIPENSSHPDVYLPRRQMQGLMNNDKVQVAVFSRKHRKGLFSGKILKLIERRQDYIVGQYWPFSNTTGLIRDDSFQWGEDLKIRLDKSQKIKKGEWVQAKIIHGPESTQGLNGKVVCSLGFFPKALEDNIRVVQKHNIPASFPEPCLKEAESLSENISKDLSHRKDLRTCPFVTIDGKTAQDFDDAIYVSTHSTGWILYVAIADVSHYVKKDSALDKEAYKRGNSTYFPNFTLPMLPEKLSNHLCSLKPKEDRLAFVAEIHFDKQGKKGKTQFYEAIIQSHARLNYGEAQDIIEQTEWPIPTPPKSYDEKIKHCVATAGKLAQILLKLRLKNHFINLDIPETEVKLNSLGEPMDITQSHRLFSHQLIEELMLATNKSVAEYLQKNKIFSLYRIHDPPKTDGLKFLGLFIQNMSIKVNLSEPDLQKKISLLIEQFADHPTFDILQMLILRSLSQAVYKAHNKKHFGLNTQYYTHFTSPIRRYSDLIVHRILKATLDKQKPLYKKEELESIATLTSSCEQRSVKAERQLKDIKKARFIKKHLGAEMEGIISGVTRFGFFVKLRLYDIEGLVPLKSLQGEWKFEESLLELKSKVKGERFKMGDPVVIQVIHSNIETGQIDFDLKTHKGKKTATQIKKSKQLSSYPTNSSQNNKNRRGKTAKKGLVKRKFSSKTSSTFKSKFKKKFKTMEKQPIN